MFNAIKTYASSLFTDWVNDEINFFVNLLEARRGCRIIDIGCGDGRLTKTFAEKSLAGDVVGVDVDLSKPKVRIENFKKVKKDLNQKLPFRSNYFDAVISHFNLEHLYNSGIFISESHRILKKGGYTVVATDNFSAWPNIISLLFGWQPFSTTSGVGKSVLGNPLALRANFIQDARVPGEYSHNKVMAYQMLIDAYREYNFKIESVIGVGYFLFRGSLSNLLCAIDKRHAHFLIIKARK